MSVTFRVMEVVEGRHTVQVEDRDTAKRECYQHIAWWANCYLRRGIMPPTYTLTADDVNHRIVFAPDDGGAPQAWQF